MLWKKIRTDDETKLNALVKQHGVNKAGKPWSTWAVKHFDGRWNASSLQYRAKQLVTEEDEEDEEEDGEDGEEEEEEEEEE